MYRVAEALNPCQLCYCNLILSRSCQIVEHVVLKIVFAKQAKTQRRQWPGNYQDERRMRPSWNSHPIVSF